MLCKRGINQEGGKHEFQERNDSTREKNEGNFQDDGKGKFQERTWQQTRKPANKEDGEWVTGRRCPRGGNEADNYLLCLNN